MDQENFEVVNEQIKTFISNFQENPFLLPIKRMISLHKRLVQSVENLEDNYVKETLSKMDIAIQMVQGGQENKLFGSDNDSYHTLLWQIHQYLIKNHFAKES